MPFRTINKSVQVLKKTLCSSSVLFLASFSHAEITDQKFKKTDEQLFQACLDDIRKTPDFSRIEGATFELHRPFQADLTILDFLNYQPEFKKEPWDYHASLVDHERVTAGINLKHELYPTLSKIEQQYGIKKSDVLAVWGIESNYGQSLGKKNVLTSLSTLSCFGRRQQFFRKEFSSALLIVQNGDLDADDMNGSWAGAFGQTQFMPSTYLHLAQDFDGDGKKDVVNSREDALASTANFLKNSGYKSDEAWGYEVKLPLNFNAKSDRKNKKDIKFWRDHDFKLVNGSPLPDGIDKLALLMPSGPGGPAFLTGKNFDTFYSYNASESYALAIAHLSNLIEKESLYVHFNTPWPTDDPGITRLQNKDIQKALVSLGYDIGEVDGLIGSKTRIAIKKFQTTHNLNSDGRAGKKLYDYFDEKGYFNFNNSMLKQDSNSTHTESKTEPQKMLGGKTIIFALILFISFLSLFIFKLYKAWNKL